ncbi:MAG: hypothetical protein WBD01_08230 [Salaquimonas sp.]
MITKTQTTPNSFNAQGARLVKTLIAVILASSVLTACQNNKAKVDPLAGGGGLTGNWVSADNVFSAQLNNGQFISTANDTGETLSEGRYIVISASEIELSWTGRLSQQSNIAKCRRDGEGLLNCTDQQGKTFTLRKTSTIG